MLYPLRIRSVELKKKNPTNTINCEFFTYFKMYTKWNYKYSNVYRIGLAITLDWQ